MNIIEIEDAPEQCPVCGSADCTRTACAKDCVRLTVDTYVDGTKFGDAPQVHIHVQCSRCSFTFLSAPILKDEVKRLW